MGVARWYTDGHRTDGGVDWARGGIVRVVIVAGARTPFGGFGGAFRDLSATDLAVCAAEEALARAAVDVSAIESVVFGNAVQTSPDAPYLARHVGLRVGLPVQVPAYVVGQLCGSGMQAVLDAALRIEAGHARAVLAGGAENMSQAPHAVYGARWGLGTGPATMEDVLWAALTDRYCGLGMAETAEMLAEQHGITRESQDQFALRSHRCAAGARTDGRLAEEIVPVSVLGSDGRLVEVAADEQIRADATAERMAALPARFRERGTVTAGNASGINDGAVALVLAEEGYARQVGLASLGRIVSWSAVGVEPRLMGLGAIAAARQALERAALTVADLARVEIHETFAVQYLVAERELGLDRAKVNVDGGAISIGHPLGASGARLLLTLLHGLRRAGGGYGLAAMPVGGGQGLAVVVESIARA